ncbi:alpha-N-acetylgalactosaminide alpha-2,6-sialyltransferase 1-like [Hoplias malabaricus]|uniref:alpha-N-acetylgalactosaminide alpha-2,6-sialyltransferase 1-like n=1 Tax=Hoplias malabaricus TaxID=27720 RepID=UPI0034617E3A
MRKVVPLVVSLLFCTLFYLLIWKRFQGTWTGPQKVYSAVLKSEFLWRLDQGTATILAPFLELSSNKTTKSAVKDILPSPSHVKSHQEMLSGNHNLSVDITVMPVLFKKNFSKYPTWDFEDVYLKNNQEKGLVCSQSLWKSKNKEFQAAGLHNIQLWLHNGLLNISEWNRLSHFNNPFGFMEYTYNDIKPAVDLISKPKFPLLFAVPEGAHDGCIRCAVVGTGGILNGSGKGQEIDSHHYVFRMNGAVIKGYEEDVGNKTSVYVHTAFALHQSYYRLKKYGFSGIPKNEGIKCVIIPEGLRDFEWIQGLLQNSRLTKKNFVGVRPLTFYDKQFEKDRFYVLHPDFLRYVRNRFLLSKSLNLSYWHIYRPTNGAFTLFLALHTCDIVNVYGFITEDYKKYSTYYFERATKTNIVFYVNHDYNLEIQTWKKLHDSGIINLYQRKENLNGT